MPQNPQPYNPYLAINFGGQAYDPRQDALGVASKSSAIDRRMTGTVNSMGIQDTPSPFMLNGQSSFVSALPGWDEWFGRLDDLGRGAAAQGKRQVVDYMGKGPGTHTGFGDWYAQGEEPGALPMSLNALSRFRR